MQGTSWRLILLTCILVVPLLLLAAACGGDDATEAPAPVPTPTPVDVAAITSDLRQSITDAVAGIEIPEGMTQADVEQIVESAVSAAVADSPEQLSEPEIRRLVAEAVAQAIADSPDPLTEEQIAQIVRAAIPTPVPAAPENPFVIGAMGALSGGAESYGIPIQQAMILAEEEINAAGGINGRMLEIVYEDSKCAAADAITAYNKLTDVDGVKIILGTTCSGAMLGAAPLAEEEGVIMLSASATSPDIAQAGDYIFRTAINDLKLGIDIGNTMWVDGVRNLATITQTTDYAEGVRRTTVARFEELGGTVVAAEAYSQDVIDFRSQLTKLINANPDAILLVAQFEASGGTIVKQARELGFDGQIYSDVVPTQPDSLEIAGDAATGLKALVPDEQLDTTKGKDFLADFEARFGNVAPLPWFQGSAYDDVYIAAECLRQTGDDQDSDGFMECLYGLTFSGAIGDNYTFDSNGDVVGLSNAVVQVLPLAERTEKNLGKKRLGPAPSVSDEPFVIGAMGALSGGAESYGIPIQQAMILAEEEINATGGINGRMLKIIYEDSKCAAADAITAYNKLTDVDGVKIILGTTCSGAMLGAAPLAEEEGVIMLSASATSPDIAQAGDYIFRTAINDLKLGNDIGNTMWVDGVRNLATITQTTDYAEGVRRTTVARFEELGGTVVAAEAYSQDVIDFRSQLTKLINANPDAILLVAQFEASGGTIVKQARELGFDGQIYSDVVPTQPDSLEIAGDAATGLKALVPDEQLDTTKGKDFLADFEARFGNVAPLPWFQGSAYDDVYIAAECLRQTGDDQDSDGFMECLYGLTFSGAIGDNYTFDSNGDVVGLSNAVVQVLPLAERTEKNLGKKRLGPAPTP